MSPLAGHGFQGLGPESFTRMWRMEIKSLHLWYQQFLTEKSNPEMLVWKISYFCIRKGPNVWSLFLSRVWIWRPRRQNFTQTFLSSPRRYDVFFLFFEISEPLDWGAMSCSPYSWNKYIYATAQMVVEAASSEYTLSVSFGHDIWVWVSWPWVSGPPTTEAVTWVISRFIKNWIIG